MALHRTTTRNTMHRNVIHFRVRAVAGERRALDAMGQFLLALLLLTADPAVRATALPAVVFAPDAWSDPPKNRDFKSCKTAHPGAVSPEGPNTKAPVMLPVKSATVNAPGRVIAELYVDETGKLREIRVIRAQGEEFVARSIQEWKTANFKPGTAEGQPVAMCFAINRWTEVR